jgi:heme-degrading monooxygenase HmoA
VGIFLSLSWWDNRNDSRDWEEEEQQWKRYREHRDGPEDLI